MACRSTSRARPKSIHSIVATRFPRALPRSLLSAEPADYDRIRVEAAETLASYEPADRKHHERMALTNAYHCMWCHHLLAQLTRELVQPLTCSRACARSAGARQTGGLRGPCGPRVEAVVSLWLGTFPSSSSSSLQGRTGGRRGRLNQHHSLPRGAQTRMVCTSRRHD